MDLKLIIDKYINKLAILKIMKGTRKNNFFIPNINCLVGTSYIFFIKDKKILKKIY